MTSPSLNNSFYAKGWLVNGNNWWHTGALDGTATFAARTSSGFTWAVFLNERIIGVNETSFWSDLDNLPWSCLSSTTTYPSHDLFQTPNIPATNISFTGVNASSCQLNWTPGNGNRRIIIGKANSPIDKFPVDGISYTANASFGAGSNLGNGNFVVYDGNGSVTEIANLSSGTSYYFRIFEYNQNTTTGNNKLYLLPKSESYQYNGFCASVDLNIFFDGFPGQTSWEIAESVSVTVMASGSNYGSLPGYTNQTESSCLPDGCYTLTFYDALNNGMCPFQSSAIGVSTFITPGTLITPGGVPHYSRH